MRPSLAGAIVARMIANARARADGGAGQGAGAAGIVLLGGIVSALLYYKWGGSLRALSAVRASGKLPISPRIVLDGGALATTAAYFGRIWVALVYGVLIGAAVQSAVPAGWMRRWLGGRGPGTTLAGALAGAPLMLCSCCATPVFTGLYRRGARLEPALAALLASPGLNVVAIVLTFALFPWPVGVVRVVAALVIVLGLSAWVGRRADRGHVEAPSSAAPAPPESMSWRDFGARFARNVLRLVAVTLPLIVAGVALSGLVLPHVGKLTGASPALAVAAIAAVATVAALPTFFEIPIGLLMLAAGAPLPAVAAFVVAGPVVNLPSLFVLGREAGPRVALALGGGVWLVATASGLMTMI
ncbi:MAG TPA: permease [Polyangiaceae bacterium]|nr:permease [Polyangiaceae bacterium]